jgi:hypothetical protein
MKYICKYCNGQGETLQFTELCDIKNGRVWQRTKLCLHCMGKGYLDWIENITGPDRSNASHLIQTHWSTVWGSVDEDKGDVNYEV